jgi:hypothetical protein
MHALAQSHPASWWIGFVFGAIGASLMVGALLGLIPLVLGKHLDQPKLGRVGFLASVAGGFLAGVFGALPVSLAFVVTIFVRWKRGRKATLADVVGRDP